MRALITALMLGAAATALLAACQQETETQVPSEPERAALIEQGRAFYETNCMSCHQADGTGMGAFPPLRGNSFVTTNDPTATVHTVLNGRNAMPAFRTLLDDQQIAAVVSYIRNSFGNNASIVTAEQVAEVR